MTLGLRQLRYFLAIADAGALSRAAENLNVAQSALSHHLAEIERTLAVKLFDRKARGVSLTAAGHRLHEHAGAILSALSKAEEDVRTFADVVSGPVSLGLSHTAVAMLALEGDAGRENALSRRTHDPVGRLVADHGWPRAVRLDRSRARL